MKSDSQLQRDVSAELRWEPAVRAARIGVEVNAGVVTLAGQVESCSEKWHAERGLKLLRLRQSLADVVPGGAEADLVVRPPGPEAAIEHAGPDEVPEQRGGGLVMHVGR